MASAIRRALAATGRNFFLFGRPYAHFGRSVMNNDVRNTRWIALVGIWAALGLVLSSEVYFSLRPTQPDITLVGVMGPQYLRVSIWALLTPIVLGLRRLIPLSTGHWVGGLAFHTGLSVLIMLV
jgi:hypothetical protein